MHFFQLFISIAIGQYGKLALRCATIVEAKSILFFFLVWPILKCSKTCYSRITLTLDLISIHLDTMYASSFKCSLLSDSD